MQRKKVLYVSYIGLQGIGIISTIINLIYCAVSSTQTLFITSIYYIPFVPFLRYTENQSIIELFLIVFFLLITIILFVLSSRELLDTKNEKNPFSMLNIIWYSLSFFLWLFYTNMTFSQMMRAYFIWICSC